MKMVLIENSLELGRVCSIPFERNALKNFNEMMVAQSPINMPEGYLKLHELSKINDLIVFIPNFQKV